MTKMPPTKLSVLLGLMASEDWRKAIALAAKFQDLGDQRGAVLDAHMAYTNPRFVRGIKKEPEALIVAGIAALKQRYHFK
jgi:hypothetical protein